VERCGKGGAAAVDESQNSEITESLKGYGRYVYNYTKRASGFRRRGLFNEGVQRMFSPMVKFWLLLLDRVGMRAKEPGKQNRLQGPLLGLQINLDLGRF
jgi:hypothetical protein